MRVALCLSILVCTCVRLAGGLALAVLLKYPVFTPHRLEDRTLRLCFYLRNCPPPEKPTNQHDQGVSQTKCKQQMLQLVWIKRRTREEERQREREGRRGIKKKKKKCFSDHLTW